MVNFSWSLAPGPWFLVLFIVFIPIFVILYIIVMFGH